MTDSEELAGLLKAESYVRQIAERYIAGRDCSFEVNVDDNPAYDFRVYEMKLVAQHATEFRTHQHFYGTDPMETLDVMVALMTHMAVKIGLIETTPKPLIHTITVIGSDGGNTEVQLDGHSLRGLYEFDYKVDASGEPTIRMGFSRSQVHLDIEVLPESLEITLQGFDELIEVGQALTKLQDQLLKDEHAAKISSEFADLWQRLHNALHMYTPLQSDDEPKVH